MKKSVVFAVIAIIVLIGGFFGVRAFVHHRNNENLKMILAEKQRQKDSVELRYDLAVQLKESGMDDKAIDSTLNAVTKESESELKAMGAK